jgi:uncharacterized membrane protein YphA (DoxX/SURF4 family)
MKFLRNLARILTGLVFIFSGFVKGVDPMGTAYKFEDYFIALNLTWMMGATVFLAILLIAAEFIIGWLLLFNIRTKLNAWFVLGFMLLFTPVTLWLAITNKVTDCGCFGDFLVMTNMQTFLKNLVILVVVIYLFAVRRKFRNPMAGWLQVLVGLIGVTIIVITMNSGYNHEPCYDFRPFYKGANLSDNLLPTPEIAEINLIYKHADTGEELSYTPKTLPFRDSLLWPKLTFVRQEKKVLQPFAEAKAAFEMFGADHKDYSHEIIGSKDFLFILIMQEVSRANSSSFKQIIPLIEEAGKRNIRVIAITGSPRQEVDAFMQKKGISLEHYTADVTKLKTVVRANPGLLLLKNGYVIGKWHYHDIPDLKTLELEAPMEAFAPLQ